MIARRRPVAAAARPAFAVVLGGLALVVGALAAASTRLLLHGCVQADGTLGVAGMRLAVLRRAAYCPDGTLGAGPTALVLLSVALPVLVAYVALALGGLGAIAAVRRAARVLARLVRPVVLRLDRLPAVVVRRLGVVGPLLVPDTGRVLAAGIARRGPPALA